MYRKIKLHEVMTQLCARSIVAFIFANSRP